MWQLPRGASRECSGRPDGVTSVPLRHTGLCHVPPSTSWRPACGAGSVSTPTGDEAVSGASAESPISAPLSPAEARLGLARRQAPAPRPCLRPHLPPPRGHIHSTPPASPSLVSSVPLTPLGAVLSAVPVPGASGEGAQCHQGHRGPCRASPWAAVLRGNARPQAGPAQPPCCRNLSGARPHGRAPSR